MDPASGGGLMFCSGAIRFVNYLECPFYVAFCEVMDVTSHIVLTSAHKILTRESAACMMRCDNRKKEEAGT